MATFDQWQTAQAVISGNTEHNVLLYGPAGTGKSFAAQAGHHNVRNITITPETPMAELRGHYHPKGGEFIWQDGPVVRAMREGGRVVLNEVDHAGGDVISFLLAAMDNKESCRICLPSGETVRPSAGFHVIGTMNGQPDDLLPALKDRFTAAIPIDTPHPDALNSLPSDLREAAKSTVMAEKAEDRIGLRAWLAFAGLRGRCGNEMAAQAVFGNNWQAVVDSLAVATVSS